MCCPYRTRAIALVLAAFLVGMAGCTPSTPEPVAVTTITAPAATASVPAPADQGSSVVARGNAAFRAGRRFEPREDNAFELFTAAMALSPDDPAAREAACNVV